MAITTPVVVSLASRVNEIDPANKEANLSWILGVGAIVAMLANPIVGQLSDRTTSLFGMRKPWMLAGTPVMPDQVPEEQRGVVSGAVGVCLQVGIVCGVYLAQAVGSNFQMFMAPGAIFLVLLLVFFVSFEDRRLRLGGTPKLANALPQTVAPAIAPLFLMIGAEGGKGNYTSLFVAAAVLSALGALAVLPIRRVR